MQDQTIKIWGKFLLVFLFAAFILVPFSEAAKKKKEKDCIYCKKYEKMKDWPESERPTAFQWEDIKYPEGMFLPTSDTPKKNKVKQEEKFMQDLLKEKAH